MDQDASVKTNSSQKNADRILSHGASYGGGGVVCDREPEQAF